MNFQLHLFSIPLICPFVSLSSLVIYFFSPFFFFFFFVKFIPLHFLWPWGFKLNSTKPAPALSLIKSALSFPLSLSLSHALWSTNQWALDVWISAAKYGQLWPPKDTKKKEEEGKKKKRDTHSLRGAPSSLSYWATCSHTLWLHS